MSDIHPTATGADGRRVPRRTTYKPGDRRIELIRCAQCGFLFREGIDVESDSKESPGISHADTTETVSRDNSKLPQPLKGMTKFSNGTIINTATVEVTSGCRFCGSLNPRGNGRYAKEWFGSTSMENR